MSDLDAVVSVSITATTTTPSQAGFGTPLILAQHTHFVERYRIYTTLAGMVADGFVAGEPAHRAATSLLQQNPSIPSFVVGRAANDQVQTYTITPVAVNSTAYTLYINGTAGTYTSDATASVAEITAGLKVAIDLLGENITVTDNTTDLTIAANTVPDAFSLYPNDRTLFVIENITADLGGVAGVAQDITDVNTAYSDWYCLILCNQGLAVQTAAAALVETLTKYMPLASADSGIYNGASTTDIAYVTNAANYERCSIIYDPKAIYTYPDAGWAGRCLPDLPGSITWAFKQITGSFATQFTSTEITAMEAKKANYYTERNALSRVYWGYTAAGTFIDVTRSVDFISSRLQEYIYALLATSKKVPFTDTGIAQIEAQVRAVLELSVSQGILNPDYVISVPLASAVSDENKALRKLTLVSFTGTLKGAIHKVIPIAGEITA